MKTLNKQQQSNLLKLLAYTDRYDLSIQFWVESTNVYINKANVELQSYGGDFDHAIGSALKYLDRINRVKE